MRHDFNPNFVKCNETKTTATTMKKNGIKTQYAPK